jgi:hypothetical protein
MRITCSEECSKSELDLFSVPPTQVAIKEGIWDNIKPFPNYNEGTITFDIPADSKSYLNINMTELWVTARLKKKDSKNKDEDVVFDDQDATKIVDVAPVNNLLHSLFSQVQVYLNNREVENTNANYAHKAYMANLLSYGTEAKATFLTSEFFYKDEAGKMDKLTVLGSDKKVQNSGAVKRYNIFKANNQVQMRGRLHCDFFNTNKVLLSNVPVTIRLTKNKPEFYLIGNTANCFIEFDEIFLRVRRIKLSEKVMLDHAMGLELYTAKYPIKRNVVKHQLIPYSSQSVTISNIHTGFMPNRVVLGFLKNSDYDGSLNSNPFNFRTYGVKQLTLKVSSRAVVYSAGIKMDYETNRYLEAYSTLFQNIQEVPNDITYSEYNQGYTLYAFDLSPDMCNGDHFNELNDGNLELEVIFNESHKEAITILFYLEFDNLVEITKHRNVVFDYQI